MTLPHREYAAELARTLTGEVNSDAVQEFLEAKGVDYDHTDVAEIERLIERVIEMPQTPGTAVDLIEHAAGIIAAKSREPNTAPYHWAGALWEAGMLCPPGTARSTYADVSLIVAATEQHCLVTGQPDADGHDPCSCGQWREGADGSTWDEHMAEVTVAALAAAGRLA